MDSGARKKKSRGDIPVGRPQQLLDTPEQPTDETDMPEEGSSMLMELAGEEFSSMDDLLQSVYEAVSSSAHRPGALLKELHGGPAGDLGKAILSELPLEFPSSLLDVNESYPKEPMKTYDRWVVNTEKDFLLLATVLHAMRRPEEVRKLDESVASFSEQKSLATGSDLDRNGAVRFTGTIRSKNDTACHVNLTDCSLKGPQRGKVMWENGFVSEIVADFFGNASRSSGFMESSASSSWSSKDSDNELIDAPPIHEMESVLGLALRDPMAGRKPGGHLKDIPTPSNIVMNENKYFNTLIRQEKITVIKPRTDGSPRIQKRLGRSHVKSRHVENLSEEEIARHKRIRSLRSQGERVDDNGKQKKKPEMMANIPLKNRSTEMVEDPRVMLEGKEEPAICKRCNLIAAGKEHFEEMHNGLLTDEQEHFSLDEKRARWNGIIKKKMKLRCQLSSCQKIVSSSTAMKYHEQTCGVPIKKGECPRCGRKIAQSYLHQHVMSHDRENGVYNRPRKSALAAAAAITGSSLSIEPKSEPEPELRKRRCDRDSEEGTSRRKVKTLLQ